MPKINIPTLSALGFAAAAAIVAFISMGRASTPWLPDNDAPQEWAAFGGNQQAQKYSTATQITPDNVKSLQQAWSIHTGDLSRSGIELGMGSHAFVRQ